MSAPPAAQRAYEATKDLILSGELPAGSLLSEGEIADRLSVSRTPVREAFLRLEAEEFLRLIPKRGAVVVPVGPTEAADILDLRRALESAAVRRLVLRDDLPDVVAQLGTVLDDQDACADLGDVTTFAALDEKFHRTIVVAAGNALATRSYTALADRQRRMTIGAVGLRPERLADLVAGHRALLGCIRDADHAAFVALLDEHLDTTHRVSYQR